jgi:DNA-binding response OmpR family regulator
MSHATGCFEDLHYGIMHKIGAGHITDPIYGDLKLCLRDKALRGNIGQRNVSSMEFQIMWLLIRANGGLITHSEFVYFIYESDERDLPLSNSMEVLVSRVRKKLRSISQLVAIDTFRGVGYKLSLRT